MNHLFMARLKPEAGGYALYGPPKDLLAGVQSECPVAPFGGAEDFSANATHVALSMRSPLAQDEAWTTNRHIYLRQVAGKPGELGECLTADNSGYDLSPQFSPDGQRLAWLSMATPQYESDASRIKLRENGAVRTLL